MDANSEFSVDWRHDLHRLVGGIESRDENWNVTVTLIVGFVGLETEVDVFLF